MNVFLFTQIEMHALSSLRENWLLVLAVIRVYLQIDPKNS